MQQGIRIPSLIACLRDLPALEIKGVELLRQFHPLPGQWLLPAGSIPHEALVEATVQLIEYGRQCRDLIHAARQLPPVPLVTACCPEFGL